LKKKKKDGTIEPPKTYPVGNVEIMDVEPVSFPEFLREKDNALWEYYMSVHGVDPLPEIFHRRLWDAYCIYLTVGGMPEVVASHLSEGDPAHVSKLQQDLVTLYENDIVKYNGEIDAAKILAVLRSVVPQLAKENSKFVYGAIREGARGRGYEEAIEWLVSARMVRRVRNLDAIEYPLSAHDMRNAFKLYLNDIGMLKVTAGITDGSLILDKDFAFKGRFVENYVLQQLAGRTIGPVHYWAERADREIDFVIQHEDNAVPVEVKAGGDKKASSFKGFVNSRHPKFAIRFSERNLKKDGAFVNIPLYLAPRFSACLQ
jgi:predicted AAA+ superfamily ATPase